MWQELAAKIGIWGIGLGLAFLGLMLLVRALIKKEYDVATATDDAKDTEEQIKAMQRGEEREAAYRQLSRADKLRRMRDKALRRSPQALPGSKPPSGTGAGGDGGA